MFRLAAILCCTGALVIAGCGGSASTSSSTSRTATTRRSVTRSASTSVPTARFLVHMGLAYGALHHFIYGPLRSGQLTDPLSHPLALVRAGLAALFVSHELTIAVKEARSSRELRPVVAPLTAAAAKLRALKTAITSGSFNAADLQGLQTDLSRVAAMAKAAGHTITETVPSLSQLTAGAA